MTSVRIGLCPACHRHIKVARSGRLVPHGPAGNRCDGSGRLPEQEWTRDQ